MTYKVIRDEGGRPSVALQGEPPYVQALTAAPSMREPELGHGRWLVMAFAAWSMPDIQAIQTALDAAGRFGGSVALGLRPFDETEEFAAWCPGLDVDARSPVWLFLSDGELRGDRRGILTVDELVEMIETRDVA